MTCGRAIVACATHLFGQPSEAAAVYIRSRQIDFPRIQVVFLFGASALSIDHERHVKSNTGTHRADTTDPARCPGDRCVRTT